MVLLSLLVLSACDWPFNTKPTVDDAIFKLSAELNPARIVSFAYVDLSWPAVGIDDFREIRIARVVLEQQDSSDEGWLTRAVIANPHTSSWRDTLFDDESVRYRLSIYKQDGPAGDSDVELVVPPTTSLTVPSEIASLRAAMESPLIDDGDTLFVLAGKYTVYQLDFRDRAVHLIGVEGAANTCLTGLASYTSTNGTIDPTMMITMSGGLIQGFTIAEGASERGGAVEALGSCIVRQCMIINNMAVPWWGAEVTDISGYGGGLLLADNARAENCIIFNNVASRGGDGIFVHKNAQDVRIVNCTIYANTGSGIQFASSGAAVENCIVVGNRDGDIPSLPPADYPELVAYSNAGVEWAEANDTNIGTEVKFVNPTTDGTKSIPNLHLLPSSPCIDAGNPDPAYNDPDGSRNDMGAFGGPWGNWKAIGCYINQSAL